jgi:hypothetical protein
MFYVGPDVRPLLRYGGTREVATSHSLPGTSEQLSVTCSFKVLTDLDKPVNSCL